MTPSELIPGFGCYLSTSSQSSVLIGEDAEGFDENGNSLNEVG